MRQILTVAVLALSCMASATAQPIKIAVIQDATGSVVLESYAKQVYRGFDLGIAYATDGTGEVKGRAIQVIKKDTNVKPDRARALLAEAYQEGAILAVGTTSSGIAKAMLPVAEEYGRILLVSPAVADSITGEDWNRFIFKTSRNNSYDMQAQAIAMGLDKDTAIGVIGEDYAFVRDGVVALKKAAEKYGAKVLAEEYVPTNTTDLTPALERLAQKLSGHKGRKIIFPYFGFLPNYMGKIANWDPSRYGLDVSAIVVTLPILETYKDFPGMEGSAFYYYDLPNNPVNDWLVKEHQDRFNEPPDFFTVEGFTAAMAIVTALKQSVPETEALIKTMKGMSFESPKGVMRFRPEDHQATMPMYHVKLEVDPNVAWAVPKLVREIGAEEMEIPINN
ncbi:substrate-binding domain-containing protein [Alcaligenaceae bacterium]|nr:substrate-binding domain-containing protein [Alcaligenaceae bacterium]